MIDRTRLIALTPYAQAALRIMAGLLFMQHGLSKLIGFPPGGPPAPSTLLSVLGVAGFIEAFGGGLFTLGLYTRGAAFIMSGQMAVGYFMAHAPRGFFPIANGGDGAILFCFVFLFFAAAGPGALSIDGAMGAGSKTPS